jgi:tetratricopeptide (TPR) repeat protein/HEAT repeat protein
MRRATRLSVALVAAALTAQSAGPAAAQPGDDWGVHHDPFDRSVIARYKAILARHPHDAGALAKLLGLYRRYRTVALLEGEYQSVLARKPGDWATLVVLARLADAGGHHDVALPLWAQATAANARDAGAWVELGTHHRTAGNAAEATAAFERALATHGISRGDKGQALRALADLALAAGDMPRAKKLFDQMIALAPKDVQLRLELGDSLSQGGRHDDAIAVYRATEKLLGADPSRRVEVVARIGQALEAKGDDDAAVAEYRRAIKLAPKGYYIENELTARIVDIYRKQQKLPQLTAQYEKQWPAARRGHFEWDTLARLYEETGQQDKAIAAYRKAVAKAPWELETQRRLIKLLQDVGKDDEALAQLEKVVRVAPGEARFQLELAERYWRRGDSKQALAALGRLERRFPGDAGVQSAIADLYTRWGKDDLALAAYERLARLEPDDPGHLITLGEQYYSRGNKAKALATWKRLAGSGKAAGYAKLGHVLSEHGMTTDALANYARAIKLDPKNPDYYKGRAGVYESIKSFNEAMADWDKVLALLGDKPTDRVMRREARRRMVGILVRWGGREAQMRRQWQTAFRKTPPDLDAGYFLAAYYAKRPQAGEPRATLARLHKLVPTDQDVILDLVKALRDARQYKDAVDLLEELARIAPSREREVYTKISEIETEAHHDQAAIKWSQMALAKSPNDPTAYLHLAERYMEMQKLDKAIGAYAKVIELDPRNWKAYFALGGLYVDTGKDEDATELYHQVLRRASDDDVLARAGKLAIVLEESTGTLGELEKVVAPLAFTMSRRPVYRRILVDLYDHYVTRLGGQARRGPPELRKAAREELVRLGQHGLRPLLEALHDDKDLGQQKVAVEVLGELGNQGAAPALIHLAAAPPSTDADAAHRIGTLTQTLDWEVRVKALVAGGKLGNPDVLREVLPLTTHREIALREAAVFTAGRTGDRRAVPTLLTALGDGRESVQVLACAGLAQIDDPRAVTAMTDAVKDRTRHDLVRAVCAFGLGYRRAPAALGALEGALADNSGETQRLAAWALGRLGDGHALAPLVRAYFGRADGHRAEMAWALSRLARGGAPTAPAADLASYPMDRGKLDARQLVADLPGPLPRVAPPIAAIVGHPADVVAGLRAAMAEHRDVVVVVLADLDARDAGPGLGTLIPPGPIDAGTAAALDAIGKGIADDVAGHLKDPDPKVRGLALSVLAKVDGPDVAAAIAAGLGDPAPQVRAAAAAAAVTLTRVRGRTPAPVAAALSKALASKAWQDRRAAADALGALGAAADVAGLRKALADEKGFVREAAARSLGELRARAAVPDLIEVTRHDYASVRRAAAAALVAIGDPRARARLDELSKGDPDPAVRAAAGGH